MTDSTDPKPERDATDIAAEQIIPPEQAPMDDAAGGPQVSHDDDQADVTVSGAE